MSSSRSHLDLTIASISIFCNDGMFDAAELDRLLRLVLIDGAVDEDEKRMLGKIFAQAEQTKLDPTVARRTAEIRAAHAIS